MRRIKPIFLSVLIVIMTGFTATFVNAQAQYLTEETITNPVEFNKAGIDATTVSGDIEEAITYSKLHLEDLKNGNQGYSAIQREIALKYFADLATYLADNGQKNITVSDGIVKAYLDTKQYVLDKYGNSELQFLIDLVDQTVNDLQ